MISVCVCVNWIADIESQENNDELIVIRPLFFYR